MAVHNMFINKPDYLDSMTIQCFHSHSDCYLASWRKRDIDIEERERERVRVRE